MRVATEGLLADFLREIRVVTNVQKHQEEQAKAKREATLAESFRRHEGEKERLPDITMDHPERGAFITEHDDVFDNDLEHQDDRQEEQEVRETGSGYPFNVVRPDIDEVFSAAWLPGQGVRIDYAAIVEILLQQLDDQRTSPMTSYSRRKLKGALR